MLYQNVKWVIVLLLGTWLLAACAPGAQPPTAGNAAPRQAGSLTTKGDLAVPVDLPFPVDGKQAADPVALAYHPADDKLLLATGEGLFRWQAGAWQSVALPPAVQVSGVTVNPDQPDTVYVSGVGLGVVRSDDGGTTWQTSNTGLPDRDATALALHSFERETLYAWLKDDGIYRTEDGGANWVRLPDRGPEDKDVRGLIHSTLPGSMNTGWLYASTPTGGYLSMDCF